MHQMSPPTQQPTTKVLWVFFSSMEVGVGSCLEGLDVDGNIRSVFVASCEITNSSLFTCKGYELRKGENESMYLGPVCSISLSFITNSFVLYPHSRKGERSFWPYFIRFINDVPDPSPNSLLFSFSLPYSCPLSLLMSFPHQVSSFLDAFLKKINHHLQTGRSRGEKLLLSYDATYNHHLLSLFQINTLDPGRVIKRIDEGDFPVLASFLGKYFFRSEDDYAQNGWGYFKEPNCNHYVTQVIVVYSKSGKEMKVSAHFLLQNPKSLEFQTVGK
jgi:hypothetical protein